MLKVPDWSRAAADAAIAAYLATMARELAHAVSN
jgi:hypothetical protein